MWENVQILLYICSVLQIFTTSLYTSFMWIESSVHFIHWFMVGEKSIQISSLFTYSVYIKTIVSVTNVFSNLYSAVNNL